MNMNDAEHIWLRQTVTYTVDGQTRTLEIGVPVPRDATAEEIEELLRAADAGMGAISRRLDAHIAATSGGATRQLPAPESPTIPAAPATTATSPAALERAAANGRAPAEPAPAVEPASASQPASRSAPSAPTPTPAPTTAPAAPSASPRAAERPAAPQRPAEQPPARPTTPARPAASAPAPSVGGAEMTRPEFLSAANELGLNPRQAMDRLKVRSLEGLNLREALESLRRQMLGAAAAPEPEPEPMSEPEPEPIGAIWRAVWAGIGICSGVTVTWPVTSRNSATSASEICFVSVVTAPSWCGAVSFTIFPLHPLQDCARAGALWPSIA